MTDDQREIIRRANLARQRGNLYAYFRLLGLAGELKTMRVGPETRHDTTS